MSDSSDGRCLMFGGYPVNKNEYCDSFVRGKPGTSPMEGRKSRPHNLHVSIGKNNCSKCSYFEKYIHIS